MLFAFEVALFLFLMPVVIALVFYGGIAIFYLLIFIVSLPFLPVWIGFVAFYASKEQYEKYCKRQNERKKNGTYVKIYWYYPLCYFGGIILLCAGCAYAVWLLAYVKVNYFPHHHGNPTVYNW